jgi:alpha-galactosidase
MVEEAFVLKKIAFIGAGSFGFTRKLVRDILSLPAFADSTIALMDVDMERLSYIKRAVDKVVAAGQYPAKVIATQSRAEALQNADGVVCTILANSVDVWRHDIEIPKRYGVDINVGDTRGPAGIFRALRTIPAMLDICRDIETYCPNAVFLNYTNPMTMLCSAMQNYTKVNVTGLCHSVQGTSEMLAKWIGAPMDEITYLCGGINHQAWFLEYKWNGEDAIPLIRKAITENTDIYNKELVRNEMFLHLDYYVTESSGHNSEYNAWFRKRPDLIEKYCTHGTNWNPGVHAFILNAYRSRQNNWKDEILKWLDQETVDLKRGHEYAADIFNAVLGDGSMFKFYGNIRNQGYITNLPQNVCVEVPILASKSGLEPIHVGALPSQLAILNHTNAMCEQLAVEGSMEGDPRKIFHAIVNDPLTSAVLSMDETKQMVDELFAVNRDYLPQFKHST